MIVNSYSSPNCNYHDIITLFPMPQSTLPRNVQVYDNSDQDNTILVAGLMQLGHTTIAEFYFCLEICFQRPTAYNFRLCNENGPILSRDSPGTIVPITNYYVVSLGMDFLPCKLIISRSGYLWASCSDPWHRTSPGTLWRKSFDTCGIIFSENRYSMLTLRRRQHFEIEFDHGTKDVSFATRIPRSYNILEFKLLILFQEVIIAT